MSVSLSLVQYEAVKMYFSKILLICCNKLELNFIPEQAHNYWESIGPLLFAVSMAAERYRLTDMVFVVVRSIIGLMYRAIIGLVSVLPTELLAWYRVDNTPVAN